MQKHFLPERNIRKNLACVNLVTTLQYVGEGIVGGGRRWMVGVEQRARTETAFGRTKLEPIRPANCERPARLEKRQEGSGHGEQNAQEKIPRLAPVIKALSAQTPYILCSLKFTG